MKKITLCGSTKFRSEFEKVMADETLKGNIVISVGLFGHETGLKMNSGKKRMLDRMHFEKIDMSDEILVINPGGYIGLSTCDEIHYAIAQGKGLRFYENAGIVWDLIDGMIKAEKEGMRKIYACGCSCDPNHGHSPSCMFDNWSSDWTWG